MLVSFQDGRRGLFVRYSASVAIVAAAFLLRHVMLYDLGLSLPPFLTFYPAVFLIAILAGLGPGLMATALIVLGVAYWMLPSSRHLAIESASNAVTLAFFAATGVMTSLVAGHWRRSLRLIEDLKAEQALRQSEDKIREVSEQSQLAIDAAELGVWVIRFATGAVTWNERCRKICGYGPDDPLTLENPIDHIHPDDRARVRASVRQLIESADAGLWRQEFRLFWPDGTLRWLTSLGRLFFTGEGDQRRPDRFIGVTMDITDRMKAEAALNEMRATLTAALASTTDAVFVSDASGNFIHFNDAFASFHKFENRQACAGALSDYPAFLDVFMANGERAPLEMWAVPRALRGETATDVEYSQRRKDTGESWVGSFSFSPIRNSQGSIVGSVVVGRDITERKRQEQELEGYRQGLERLVAEKTLDLRASESRYRGLFESLPAGVVVQAADGRITDANASACEILQLTMDQISGKTSLDPSWRPVRRDGSPFPGNEHPAMYSLVTGKPQLGVVMGLGEPDERSWISINSHPLFHEGDQRPYAVLTCFVDITQRVRDEETIQILNRHYQAVLSAATEVAIVATDPEGIVTLFNAGAELMLGYTEDEVVGREKITRFYVPEELTAAARDLNQRLGNRLEGIDAVMAGVDHFGHLLRDWTFVRRDGSSVEVSASITPLRSEQAEATGYLAVIIDISDRLRLEEVLKKLERADLLTGLANRKVFEEAADRELKRVKRFGSRGSVMIAGLDHFKHLNDTLGHDSGDRALAALGKALKRLARSTDLTARLGGDEFAVLLAGAELDAAMAIAEKTRKAIGEIAVSAGGQSISLTASIGVTALTALDGNWPEAVSRAEAAMRIAKAAGRNTVVAIAPDGSELKPH